MSSSDHRSPRRGRRLLRPLSWFSRTSHGGPRPGSTDHCESQKAGADGPLLLRKTAPEPQIAKAPIAVAPRQPRHSAQPAKAPSHAAETPRAATPPAPAPAATPAPAAQAAGAGGFSLYTEHFGLNERPFSLLPDPDFLFWSSLHSRAFAMLEYGILTRAPITLITGEVGAGKTTLMQKLLNDLEDDLTVGLVSNAHGDRGELLRWVLMALNQTPQEGMNYVDLFAHFQRFLIAEYARGNRVILIFDEAQNMTRESLEELRMFTNINSNKDELLQIVLIGQPELRDVIRRPDMLQFAQRVAASFHLGNMSADMVRDYIGHRLHVAGATTEIFTEAACTRVHEATGGVPRLVNQLCDLAMVYAYTEGAESIDRQIIDDVLTDGVFFGQGTPDFKDEPD